MLTRSNRVAPQQEYYADSLLKMPTTSDTVFHNLAAGIATPVVALNMLDSQFSKKPEGQAILSSLNSIKLENETPGMTTSQWLLGEGANMLGFGLNPATWGLGEGGALAARGIGAAAERLAPDAASVFMRTPIKSLLSQPLGKFVPEMVGREGEEKPLSLSLVSSKTMENFGTFAGAGVPQGIVDNYNQDTGHIAWGGAAREMGEMGAFGIAIGSIPFALGVLRGKVNRALGKDITEDVKQSTLDEALDKGHITKQEHSWYSDYLEHKNNPSDIETTEKLKSRASEIINQNGHSANTVTNEAKFEMLTPDDVTNLQGVVGDQLSGNVPDEYKKALSDFVIHGRLDFMRQTPQGLDGVRGYVDHINEKLSRKPEKIAEADSILDRHMLKSVKENMPFSQKEIFKHMKKAGFESSHVKHLPMTIPENMATRLRLMEKIDKFKEKIKKEKRRGLAENKQTLRRISELEGKLPKILTPKEELIQLKQDLLGKGLKKNFEHSTSYHRLLDLAHVWHNGRTLIDRVHLEHEYKRQEAFRDLAHQTLKIADSDMPRLAKPENVMDYLSKRIEGELSKLESISEVKRVLDDHEDVPADADSVLDAQAQEIKNSKANDAKKEFTDSTDRFKEFKDSENIFKNLISCVIGGLGG